MSQEIKITNKTIWQETFNQWLQKEDTKKWLKESGLKVRKE